MPRYKAKFGSKMRKNRATKRFGKKINKLKRSQDMPRMKKSKGHTFTYIVVVNLDVLALGMKNRINCHVKSKQIITK